MHRGAPFAADPSREFSLAFRRKVGASKGRIRVLKCRGCDEKNLEVGYGDYFVALRCPVCGWEECIADG